MPRVTIRTGTFGPDGREEELSEYLCDAPGCPNVATEALGCIREVGLSAAVCHEHSTARGPSIDTTKRRRESSG
jgi:hypothetical protein